MMAGIAAGDFWMFTDDEQGSATVRRRAAVLENLQPPADPWPSLERLASHGPRFPPLIRRNHRARGLFTARRPDVRAVFPGGR